MAKVTTEQLKIAKQNNISKSAVYSRITAGWDIQKALTTPTKRYQKAGIQSPRRKNQLGETVSAEGEMNRDEVVKVISRIKAINKTDTSGFPILVPKPLMKKAKRLGISYEAVEADDSIEQEAIQI